MLGGGQKEKLQIHFFWRRGQLIGNIWSPLLWILLCTLSVSADVTGMRTRLCFFPPAVTWCRMMKPTKISSKNVFVHLMSSPCAPCFFWSLDSLAVMESSYFPHGMRALNKLHIQLHNVVDQDPNGCDRFNQAGWRGSGTDSKNIKGHAEWIMWQERSHRPARWEPLNPLSAITLSSGARWRFSCPPMDRHHRGILHFELPVIKQCIKTSNQSTPTVPLSQDERWGWGVRWGYKSTPHPRTSILHFHSFRKPWHFHAEATVQWKSGIWLLFELV